VNRTNFYYTLFAAPLSLSYDSTGLSSPLLDATHGVRAALTVTPTLSLGPPDATFIITQIRASAYLDLHDLAGGAPGRTVIAVRGLYGYAQGAGSVTDLPPDQRFYAGGSGTVRGYRFQSVGPQFSDPQISANASPAALAAIGPDFSENTPVGGLAVDAGSVELRQRVGLNYGFAVFADAGRVGETATPFTGKYAFGVGTGLRYYTPIGPLRVDIAFPVHRSTTDDRLEVYIGLGQSF
jgi:translocation and assembly module TamA